MTKRKRPTPPGAMKDSPLTVEERLARLERVAVLVLTHIQAAGTRNAKYAERMNAEQEDKAAAHAWCMAAQQNGIYAAKLIMYFDDDQDTGVKVS